MRKFKNYGIACSVSDKNGCGRLGFNTKTCYWSADIYPKEKVGEHYSSRSYAKVCEWFTEKLEQHNIK